MSNLYGTNVSATIKPFTTADIFPTHEAQYGKGGYRTVNSENDLTGIPADTNNSGVTRLETGMLVYVISTSKIYKYIGNTHTNEPSDWEEFIVAAENEYYKVVADITERDSLTNVLTGTLAYVISENKIYKFTSNNEWVLVEGEITPVENEYYKVVADTTAMNALTSTALVGTLAYVISENNIYKFTSSHQWVLIENQVENPYYVVINTTNDFPNNPLVGMLAYVKATNEIYKYTTGNTWIKLVPENYSYTFTTQNIFTITHNLEKYPSVIITDLDGNKIYGEIQYLDTNRVKISLSMVLSGIVYCN